MKYVGVIILNKIKDNLSIYKFDFDEMFIYFFIFYYWRLLHFLIRQLSLQAL